MGNAPTTPIPNSTPENSSTQESINERFLQVIKALIAAERIRTQKELCTALGKGETFPTDVRNKKSSVVPADVAILARDYGVSVRFMLFGEGAMLDARDVLPSTDMVAELIQELRENASTLRSELSQSHQREKFLMSLLAEEKQKQARQD
jgi:hypothetical protein